MGSRTNRGSPPARAPTASSVIMMELLGRGAHADAGSGGNLLELTSVLAGEPWSMRPRSVHPALAAVADIVNDLLTDERRRLLAPLAPWLLGTNNSDERVWPALVKVCDQAAAAARSPNGPSPVMEPDGGWNGPSQPGSPHERRRGPGTNRQDRRRLERALGSVKLSATQPADGAGADAALCQVLVDCINEWRRLAGEQAVDPRLPLADCPQHLAVRPSLMRSPGCDWMEIGYEPVPQQLPACLRRDTAMPGDSSLRSSPR